MPEQFPILPSGYEFHHIGYATESVEKEQKLFTLLGYHQETPVFIDPLQGVTGCFLKGPGPRIELLENISGAITLTPWLDRGIKMYHFAYLVDDMGDALSWACHQRAKVTVEPVSAVAFNGRQISFVIFRNGFMLEFVEKQSL